MGFTDELSKLNELHSSGELSDEEYKQAKQKLLSEENKGQTAEGPDLFGVAILLLPIVGCVFLYLSWHRASSDFILLEARSVIDSAKTMLYISLAIVIGGSAVLIGMDAARLGYGKDKSHPKSALRAGPVAWAIYQILLWLVSFPYYLYTRKHTGQKVSDLAGAATMLAIIYTLAAIFVQWTIDRRIEQIQDHLRGLGF